MYIMTETERFELIDLLKGIVDKDSGSILRSLLVISRSIGKDMDKRALEREIMDVLEYLDFTAGNARPPQTNCQQAGQGKTGNAVSAG